MLSFNLEYRQIELILINVIENVNFIEAWENKTEDIITHKKIKFKIFYIGLNELIKNKSAISRFKDKEDLTFLKKIKK